jgi:hypothetical protein
VRQAGAAGERLQHCTSTLARHSVLAWRPTMERTRFIEHAGHRILLLDYSDI